MNGTIGKQATLDVPLARDVSRYRGWATVGVLAVFLVALGYAETVWLPTGLPQEQASRIALVAFPAEPASGAGLGREWENRLVEEASDAELIRTLIARLELRDPATGEQMAAQDLLARMRLGSQCIEQRPGPGQPVRGILVYNVVRGADPSQIDAIAREWSKLFVEQGVAEFPGVVIQPVGALGVPYEICG